MPHSCLPPDEPVSAKTGHSQYNLPISNETRASLEQLSQACGLDPAATIHHLIESEIRRIGVAASSSLPVTAKQQLVIQQLRSGLSVKEVAAALGITEQTVRTHILRARGRLGHSDLLSLRFH